MAAACNGGSAGAGAQAQIAEVGTEAMDAVVVQMVAKRDGLDKDEARARVADTLRLVTAARVANQQTAGEPPPVVAPDRASHLRRAARARRWLETDFEPEHRPQDIPDDDPLLARARGSQKNIHPRLHLVCQLVAAPAGENSSVEETTARAESKQWRTAAHDLFDPVADTMMRYVPHGDPDACDIMARLLSKQPRSKGDVALRVESGAFDLGACVKEDNEGNCIERRFAQEWTQEVDKAAGPGFLPRFETRFGLHLTYVREILPPRSTDDPETDAFLRAQVHPRWQAEAFDAYLDRLEKKRSVKLAAPNVGTGQRAPAKEGGT